MKTAEEFYNKKFHPKKVTVVSKETVIELMDEYAQQVSRGQVIKMLEFLYESNVENIPDELFEAIGDKNYELIYKIYYQNQQ